LSSLLPGADFFIFDNPTYHLDDLRREIMAQYLIDLVPEKQIIVLTNDKKFVNLIDQGKRIDL